jgi:hypothetical protein
VKPLGTITHLASEIEASLAQALPGQRQTQRHKLSLAVAAVLEARTGNTAEIAALLPLETERPDMRYPWLSRLLGNKPIKVDEVMAPFARQVLAESCAHGEVVLLSIDQRSIADRHSILMLSVGDGERALPLIWCVRAGLGNIGYEGQEPLLEQVRAWLPKGAQVLLLGDRFYGSVELIRYCQRHGWGYRLRLKNNLLVDTGTASTTTGGLAEPVSAGAGAGLYLNDIWLTEQQVHTHLGIIHENGHEEAWIIAMEATPNRARVLDYGARWPIEPLFSDFKSRGFNLEHSQLVYPERVACLLLMMSLALYWAARSGRWDAHTRPSVDEKKVTRPAMTMPLWCAALLANACLGSSVAYAYYAISLSA